MSEHRATIRWERKGEFRGGRYSREHVWQFDGGVSVPASPSPLVVPAPYSSPAAVDPEEAFVAAIASCHMLTFLHLASRAGHEIDSYDDEAIGVMTKNEKRVPWVSSVVLHPRIVFGSPEPERKELERLHHEAHEQCFIANSVRTVITVEMD